MRFTRRRLLELSGTAVPALATAGCLSSDGGAARRPGEREKPGVPMLAHLSDSTPLLVTPMRPGKNLVHFPDSAGQDFTVTPEDARPVRATTRVGAEGTWAEVTLPAGRSDLTVEHGGNVSTVQVHTGSGPPLPRAVGNDGPECASVALAGLVAGSQAPLTRIPADAVAPADATALRQLVGHIAAHGAPGITVAADESPRSQQAAQLVHDRAAQVDITANTTQDPRNALLIVAGWSRSAQLLDDVTPEQTTRPLYTAGVYLAPWLLYSPVVNKVPISYVPLQFNPSEKPARDYAAALANAFGGEMPSTSGFDQWRTARHETSHDPAILYAYAPVGLMRMKHTSSDMTGMSMSARHPAQWVSRGTCVPVSGPLPP